MLRCEQNIFSNNEGVVSIRENLSPDILEELDHILESKGHNIDNLETAFTYLSKQDKNILLESISNLSSALTSDEKESAILKIIDLIK